MTVKHAFLLCTRFLNLVFPLDVCIQASGALLYRRPTGTARYTPIATARTCAGAGGDRAVIDICDYGVCLVWFVALACHHTQSACLATQTDVAPDSGCSDGYRLSEAVEWDVEDICSSLSLEVMGMGRRPIMLSSSTRDSIGLVVLRGRFRCKVMWRLYSFNLHFTLSIPPSLKYIKPLVNYLSCQGYKYTLC